MQIARRSRKNGTSELIYVCMKARKCSQILGRSHGGSSGGWQTGGGIAGANRLVHVVNEAIELVLGEKQKICDAL